VCEIIPFFKVKVFRIPPAMRAKAKAKAALKRPGADEEMEEEFEDEEAEPGARAVVNIAFGMMVDLTIRGKQNPEAMMLIRNSMIATLAKVGGTKTMGGPGHGYRAQLLLLTISRPPPHVERQVQRDLQRLQGK
jgi:hypothetical protein